MVAKSALESRLRRIEERLKRIEDTIELSPVVTTFDWKDFSDRDKEILKYLYQKGREGATTTEIAEELGFPNPETSGRTIAYRRLKRIERISRRIKGLPIVLYEMKRWSLNFQDFNFVIKEG